MFYFRWIYLTCVKAESLVLEKTPIENKKSLIGPRESCRRSSDNNN